MQLKNINSSFRLQNYREIYTLYRSRAFQLVFASLLLMLILFFRLYDLQVTNYSTFQSQSDRNRLSFVPIIPYRGRIFDRNGEVLADNEIRYDLRIHPKLRQDERNEIIKSIGEKLELNYLESLKTYRKNKRHAFKQQFISFATIDELQATNFANISFLYPEVSLDYQIIRVYPYKEVATHLLGYVGFITDEDLNDPHLFSENNQKNNVRFSHIGKNGLERYYDKELRGELGYKIIEVNASGRKIRDVSVFPAKNGIDLQLNIDVKLQQYIESQTRGLRSSTVIMDVSNGEILSMSSSPAYDNNTFISGKGLSKLLKNKDKPLLNRTIKALYPPASIIKPFVALAGLHYDMLDAKKQFWANPYYLIEGNERRFHDWKKGGHGWVNLNEAMAKSSDVYFYDLGYRLGIDRLNNFLSQFSFGRKTGIDLFGELSGILPSREWKYANNGSEWISGETVITAIGQGFFLTTPLQLAVSMSSIANHGELIAPSLVRFSAQYDEKRSSHRLQWYNEDHWNEIRSSLYDVTQKPYGTANKVMGEASYYVAGKTGTSQVVNLAQDPEKREEQKSSLKEQFRDHSIFSGFAPYQNPKVAIVVVVENGGNGSGIASQLSKKFLDKYFQYY